MMSSDKKFYLVFLVIVYALVFFGLWNYARKFSGLEPLGAKVLTPSSYTEVEQTKEEDGRIIVTAHIYYVLFETELNGEPDSLWLTTKNVYGDNDRDLAQSAVQKGEPVELYLFRDSAGTLYASADASSTTDYMLEQLGTLLPLAGFVLFFLTFPGIEVFVLSFFRKKESKRIQEKDPDAIICTGFSFTYAFCSTGGLFLLALSIYLIVVIAEGIADSSVLFIDIPLLALSLFLVVAFFLLMRNRLVVLGEHTFLFRSATGKKIQCDAKDVLYCGKQNRLRYSSGSRSFSSQQSFLLKANGTPVSVTGEMDHYTEALTFAQKHYHHAG